MTGTEDEMAASKLLQNDLSIKQTRQQRGKDHSNWESQEISPGTMARIVQGEKRGQRTWWTQGGESEVSAGRDGCKCIVGKEVEVFEQQELQFA